LAIHHVVVLEKVLAGVEVAPFDLRLRPLDRLRDPPVLDGDPLFHAEPLHQAGEPVRPEDPHQVVLERKVEARRAGIALAARPACATMPASCSWYFALRTTCGTPFFFRRLARCSDFSIEIVPTRTGCPLACFSTSSSTTASNFSRSVR